MILAQLSAPCSSCSGFPRAVHQPGAARVPLAPPVTASCCTASTAAGAAERSLASRGSACSTSGRTGSSGSVFLGGPTLQVLLHGRRQVQLPTTRQHKHAGRRGSTQQVECALFNVKDRDPDKECKLREFRLVYTFDDWAAHRSTKRYLRHFMGLFSSRIVAGLRWPLLLIGLEASFVCGWEAALRNGLLPAGWPSIQMRAPVLFSMSSFALSLLLVFRTNSCYARYDEGRRLWGMMLNRVRDLARQAVSFFGPSGQRERLEAFSRWLAAYPWIMKNYCRQHKKWDDDLGSLLTPQEIDALKAADNAPLLAIHVLTEMCDRAPISEKKRLHMDRCLADLVEVMGACERILRTPIPLSYTRHTARFLFIWLLLLPFSIYQTCGWVTVFSCVVLAFFLLSIDEIAATIEEPFVLLPLEDLNQAVSANVAQFPRQMDSVKDLVAVSATIAAVPAAAAAAATAAAATAASQASSQASALAAAATAPLGSASGISAEASAGASTSPAAGTAVGTNCAAATSGTAPVSNGTTHAPAAPAAQHRGQVSLGSAPVQPPPAAAQNNAVPKASAHGHHRGSSSSSSNGLQGLPPQQPIAG